MLKLPPLKKLSFSAFIIGLMLIAQFSLQVHSIEHITHIEEESCVSYLLADHQLSDADNVSCADLSLFASAVVFSFFVLLFSLNFNLYICRAPPLKLY